MSCLSSRHMLHACVCIQHVPSWATVTSDGGGAVTATGPLVAGGGITMAPLADGSSVTGTRGNAPGVLHGLSVCADAPGNAPGVLGAESDCCCKPAAGCTSGVNVGTRGTSSGRVTGPVGGLGCVSLSLTTGGEASDCRETRLACAFRRSSFFACTCKYELRSTAFSWTSRHLQRRWVYNLYHELLR